jgi:GAF domain-containing protein
VPPDGAIPAGQGLTGWVAKRGQSLVLADLESDARTPSHGWLRRDKQAAYLGIPLKSDRRVVGVIEIYSQTPREFSRDEVQLLATFARRARLADKLVLETV